jgi:hypothetical protein
MQTDDDFAEFFLDLSLSYFLLNNKTFAIIPITKQFIKPALFYHSHINSYL